MHECTLFLWKSCGMVGYHNWLRLVLGGVSFSAFWLYPLSGGPSPVAEPVIVSLMFLAIGALFVGLGSISHWTAACLVLLGVLFLVYPAAYLQYRVMGIVAVLGFAVSVAVGSRIKRLGHANEFLAWLLLVTGGVTALIGLLQYFGLEGALWPWVVDAPGRGVAFGNLKQRNLFATLINSSLISLYWLVWRGRISFSAGLLAVFVFSYAIAASASRIGVAGLLAGSFFVWFWSREAGRNIRGLLLLSPLVYGVASWSLPWVAWLHGFDVVGLPDRVMGMKGGDARLAIWSNALDLIAVRPWFGWGWRELGYAHFVTDFIDRSRELLDNAHNLPLHLAVEFGLVVAFLVVGGVGYWVWRFRPWRVRAGDDGLAWTLVILLLLHSMVEYPLWFAPNIFLMGYCVAILGGSSYAELGDKFARVWGTSCCVLIFCFAVFAKLAYNQVAWVYSMPARGDGWGRQIALDLSKGNWLFEAQLDFAALGILRVDKENADHVNGLSERLLHFSAEPRVIEVLIESERVKGGDRYDYWVERYKVTFPEEFNRWRMSCVGIECEKFTKAN